MVGGSVVRACWARRRDRVVANDRGETRRGSSGHPRSLRAALAGLFAAALLLGWAPAASAQDARVLVYHPTPNATIDAGLDALEEAAADGDFEIQATTDPTAFTPANLADYKAVVFLNVTGDTLNSSQESALQAFIQAGNGFVGIGSSAEAETGVTFFNGLIGARPSTTVNGNYTVVAGDRVHPASRDLPLTAERNDAFYTWQSNPTGSVHTLIRVRSGEVAGDGTHPNIDRPLAWCRDFQGGRSVYTGLGRTVNSYDEAMEDHLRGAIQWAAGLVRGNCKATINSFYSATKLTQNNSPATALNQSGEPHGLSIAPNGWVIYIGRANCGDSNYIHDYSNPDVGKGCGTVHVWDPEQEENNGVTTAAIFEVYGNKGGGSETGSTHKIETGLLGVAVAPNFLETGHIYFYYYPSFNPNAEPQGLPDGAERRVTKMQRPRISRFTMDLETKKIDLDSEVIILDWESQIYSCCHRGGGMGFDSEGNLYVTTGDNNSSQGNYSGNWQSVRCPTGNPSQATASHCGDNNISYRDARRTAGNTNDLNGKMLRINPIDDIPDGTQPPIGPGSTYTIPGEDAPNGPNLFTGDEGNGNQARPEIYAMGLRNPSRLNIDPETDVPYTAWVGPDAGSPDPTQGPAKYEEFAAIPQAGNYGWPYCMGNKQAYRDRLPNDALRNDTPEGYVSGPNGTGGWYDCDNPRNDSTNNTGLTELPPVTPVNLWYGPGGGCPDFPRTASGVPTYDPGQVIQRCPYVTGGGGQAIMSGPIYGYDEDAPEGNGRWPEYWEHRPIVVDHYNGHIRHALLFDEDELGEGGLPVWADNMKSIIPAFGNYMDSKFGPDGALYVQSYGGGFFTIAGNYGLWRVTCDDCADTPGPDPQYEAVGAGEYQFSIGASGGVAYEWDFGDGSPTSAEPNPTHTYEEDGTYEVTLTVTYADGEEASKTIKVNVFANDTTPPTSSHELDPATPNGPNGKYKGVVKVTLSAEDEPGGSGVDRIEYRINGDVWKTYDGPFNVSGNGTYTIEYRAIDVAGNHEEPNSVTFEIDNTAGGGGTCLPQADDFGGDQLDGKWQIVNDNPSARSVGDDHLTLTMAQGDVYQGNFTAQNILLQDVPSGPWTVTARIKHTNISVDGRAAGLVIFGQNNPNYFAKAAIQYKINDPLNGSPINGIWMERTLTTNNAVNGSYGGNWPNSGKLNPPTDYVWVRAVFDGTNVSTYYSLDGITFTANAPSFPASALGANGVTKIGLFAKRDGTGSDATVQFDYFHVTGSADPQQPAECSTGGDNKAPVTTATVDPEEPNGEEGWYTSPVEVTLTADDGEGEGVERTEYRIDNGDWTEYDEPFTVGGDGVRTVRYRSVDVAGNEEAPKTLELRIDENAPETTATLSPEEPDGPNGSYNGPVEITLDADDGSGSGVVETQFRVDGGEWTPYVKEETILGTNASDLDDWLQAGPGGLQYNPNDGGFFRTQGGLGMAWYPKEYKDFRLRLQWRDSSSGSNGNGGVLVRFPDPRIPLDQRPLTGPGDWTGTHCSRTGSAATQPAWVAVFCGHEIQINDHQSDWQKTGSVYNFAPVEAPNAGIQPRGTWVDYEIRVEGQHYTVIRNGQVLNEFDNSIPKDSSRAGDPPTQARQFDRGYIGLQNHGSNDLIDYRNVRVLPLIEGAVEGPIVVEGEGQHKVEFRSVDAAGHTEDLKTVTFRIGDAGEEPGAPALSASVKPAKKTVKAKAKRVNLRFVVTNQGDQVAKNVKLCVKAQKKRLAVKGKQCVTVATIDAGQTVKRKFTLRVQKGARGKASKVKFVARGPGIEKRTVTARVKVKK
jgi:glucose/arabinose dehydrogenase/type 1 glutamine amidotransferase